MEVTEIREGEGAALFLLLFALVPSFSFAACTNPAGVAGQVIYNADHHVPQYCNDTDWIAMAVSAGDGGAGATPTTSGLIGHWKLDDGAGTTALDDAGSNDGTLVNGPVWTTGKIGGAVQFDGVDDLISMGTSADILGNSTAASICFWMNYLPLSVAADGAVAATYSPGWMVWVDDVGANSGRQNTLSFVIRSGSDYQVEGSSNLISPGVWDHYCATFQGSAFMRIYKNGDMNQEITTVPAAISTSTNDFRFGRAPGGGRILNAQLDDVRIYNRALSPVEVQELYSYGQLGGAAGCLAPAGVAGAINFNNDTRLLQYCDGDEWRSVGTCGEDPESSKVAHWKFDESSGTSAADSSGSGLTGTLTNGPTWQSTGGQIAGALDLDGTNDYVAVTDPGAGSVLDFTTGDSITIAAWVRPDSVSGERIILCKGATTGANDHNYCLFQTDGKLSFGFYDAGGSTFHGVESTATLTTGSWQHVGVTFTFNTGVPSAVFYRNAVKHGVSTILGGSSPYSTAPSVQNRPLWIGAYDFSGGGAVDSRFDGRIDDVRIYRRALKKSDIKALYDQGKNRIFDNGKVAHWPLDESAGTTAKDLVNVSNGTAVNSPTWTPSGGKVGGTLDFDGADDRIDAGSPAALDNLSAMTIIGWIRPDTLGEGPDLGRIIGKTTGNTAAGGWTLNLDTTNRLTFSVDYATTDLLRSSANNRITLGAWQHVAVTWTGSATATNAIIYINGTATTYSTTTNGTGGRVDDAAQNIAIGNPPGLTDRSFDGKIDDLRIYNRVLTAAEIAALYQTQVPGYGCTIAGEMLYDDTRDVMKYCDGMRWVGLGDCSGEVPGASAHWKLDETSGTSAADSSGNGLTGTLTNGPVWSGGALTFDGTNDYVSVPDPGAGSVLDFASGDSITITAWVNPDTLGDYIEILAKGGASDLYGLELGAGAGNQQKMEFYFANPAGIWHSLRLDSDVLQTGQWQHVAFVGTFGMMNNAHFYHNGTEYTPVVTAGTPYTTAPLQSNNPLIIGAAVGGASLHMDGSMDDVRIYRRILSPDEIMNLYLRGR